MTNYQLPNKIMENDYLWDKTGEDKEIEQLENALKAFRYQPTSAPILPVKVLSAEEKPRFSIFGNYFRLAAAGFACLTVLLVGLGIFLNSTDTKVAIVEDQSKPIVTPLFIPNEAVASVARATTISEPKVVPAKENKPIRPKFAASAKPVQIVFRQPERPKVNANKTIQLTAEEKLAYNQLLLALSITSDTLKEIKDKANGIEESVKTVNTSK